MQKNRFKNYGLWVSIAALIPLVFSGFGINLVPNYEEIVNMVLGILVTAGIISNPTTKGHWFKDDQSDDTEPSKDTDTDISH